MIGDTNFFIAVLINFLPQCISLDLVLRFNVVNIDLEYVVTSRLVRNSINVRKIKESSNSNTDLLDHEQIMREWKQTEHIAKSESEKEMFLSF